MGDFFRQSMGKLKGLGGSKAKLFDVPEKKTPLVDSAAENQEDDGDKRGSSVVEHEDLEETNYADNPLALMEDYSAEELQGMGFTRPDSKLLAKGEEKEEQETARSVMDQAKEEQKALWVWGYLNKKGSFNTAFKTRVFLLKPDGVLSYYEGFQEGKQVDVKTLMSGKCLGTISLNESTYRIVDRNLHLRVKDSFMFSVTPKNSDRTFVLEAANTKKRNLWLQVIEAMGGTEGSPEDQAKAIPGSLYEGYMEKMGEKESVRGWKVRYFALTTNGLSYYKDYKSAQKNR